MWCAHPCQWDTMPMSVMTPIIMYYKKSQNMCTLQEPLSLMTSSNTALKQDMIQTVYTARSQRPSRAETVTFTAVPVPKVMAQLTWKTRVCRPHSDSLINSRLAVAVVVHTTCVRVLHALKMMVWHHLCFKKATKLTLGVSIKIGLLGSVS